MYVQEIKKVCYHFYSLIEKNLQAQICPHNVFERVQSSFQRELISAALTCFRSVNNIYSLRK